MSVLEIVLTSVLGGLVLVAVFYLLVFHTNKNNRLELFEVLNDDAVIGATVFFGDSLTDFFPVQDFFPNRIIYNRGIAGDTTKDLLERLDNVVKIQPKKIIIQIGTNDLGKGVKIEKIIKNIEKIYQTLQKEVPNIEIIALSLYPVSHHKMWLSPVIAGIRSRKKILKTNTLLQALCMKLNIPFVQLYSQLADAKGRLNREYTLEGLHISGRGYAVIANVLKDYL